MKLWNFRKLLDFLGLKFKNRILVTCVQKTYLSMQKPSSNIQKQDVIFSWIIKKSHKIMRSQKLAWLWGAWSKHFICFTWTWNTYLVINPETYSHSQNSWDKIYLLCETEHYGKSSNCFFQQFFANIDKIFILGGRLGTRL